MKKALSRILVLTLVMAILTGIGSVMACADEGTENFAGTLEYWCGWTENEPQAQILLQAAADFQKLYPDVTINFTWAGRDIRNMLIAAMEGGTQIDCFDGNIDHAKLILSDYIVDMTEYMDKTYSFTNGKTYRESVIPSTVALVESLFDGQVYGIPYYPQAYLIFCNKNIFDECGITEYPTTWDEFIDVCKTIKDAGYIPITSDTFYAPSWFGYYLSRLVGDEGVKELAFNSSLWADNAAVLEAAQGIAKLAEVGAFDPNIGANVYPAAQQDMVISENIAMYINGTWLPSEVLDATSDDYVWGTMAFPEVPNEINGQEAGCYGCWGISATKYASQESKDIAAAFAAFVTTGKYDQMFADEAHIPCVGIDSTWPEVLGEAQAIISNFSERFSSQTGIVTNTDSKQIIVDACCRLYTGATTPEEFIKEASNF